MGSASSDSGAEQRRSTVLYVDRTRALAERTATRLEDAGQALSVLPAAGADEALDGLPEADCVVSEYRLGETDGISLFERVRDSDPSVPFVLFTSASVAGQAAAAGVASYHRKDGTDDQLAWLAHRVTEGIHRDRRSAGPNDGLDATRFRALVEETPSVAGLLSRDGRVEYVGPAVERVLGRRPAALVGESLADVVHPDDRGRVREALARAVRGGQDRVTVDHRFRRGEEGTFEVQTTLVNHLDDPAIEGLVLASRDVTARRRMEAARDGAIGVAAALLGNADAPLAVIEPDGRIQAASDAAPYLAGGGPLTLTPLWNDGGEGTPAAVLADATETVACSVAAGGEEHLVDATPVRVDGRLARVVVAFER